MITTLSDGFIEDNRDKLDWKEMSLNYDFSKDQLGKYDKDINHEMLAKNMNMNFDFDK